MSNIGINELDQGIWTDPNTGLIWARISIGQEWINGQCIGDAQEFNWDDANHACQSFRLAGFSDWRLPYRDCETDRKSTRLNSSHITRSRMPSSA